MLLIRLAHHKSGSLSKVFNISIKWCETLDSCHFISLLDQFMCDDSSQALVHTTLVP